MILIHHFTRASKTYCYENARQDFVINKMVGQSGYYTMTAQGLPVQPGDHIEITQPDRCTQYQVDTIEYYSEPSDMWIATLYRISQSFKAG